MQEKLAALHHLFRDAQTKGITIQSIDLNHQITEEVNEILSVFGLPMTEEFQEILFEFGRAEVLSDDLIDATLLKLADAATFHLTLSKLGEL